MSAAACRDIRTIAAAQVTGGGRGPESARGVTPGPISPVTDTIEPDEPLTRGRLLAAISNEMVRLFARHYGRGPTKARTVMAEDIVVVRMLDPFTIAEKTLIQMGRRDEVRSMRAAFQQELAGEFTGAVERLTGRHVMTFLSDISVDPEMAVAIFFLEPLGSARDAGEATAPD